MLFLYKTEGISSILHDSLLFLQSVPVEDLIRGRFKATFHFLKWFKRFFTANHSGQKYNPVAARKGVEIILASPYVRFSQSGEPSDSIGEKQFISLIL